MTPDLLHRILEADDEESIKDILGDDYMDPPESDKKLKGSVERFDRWADIAIGDKNYCISYLTPVAVYIPGEGLKLTDRYWSNATRKHIVKWADHIGFGAGYRHYAELAAKFPEVPQQSLIDMFKEDAQRVNWTKRQVKRASNAKTSNGLKSDYDERVYLRTSDDE